MCVCSGVKKWYDEKNLLLMCFRLWSSTSLRCSCCFTPNRMSLGKIFLSPCMRAVSTRTRSMQPVAPLLHPIIEVLLALFGDHGALQQANSTCAGLMPYAFAELHVVDDRPSFIFVQAKFTVEVSYILPCLLSKLTVYLLICWSKHLSRQCWNLADIRGRTDRSQPSCQGSCNRQPHRH